MVSSAHRERTMHRSFAQVLCNAAERLRRVHQSDRARGTGWSIVLGQDDPAHRLRPLPVGHRCDGAGRPPQPPRSDGAGGAGPREPHRRRAPTLADDPNGPVEAAIVSVWRDATLMARATSVEEQDRFLGTRLQLPLELVEALHYEIVGRTFAALPPEQAAYLRLLTVRARPNEEARLIETLRAQQPKFVDLGPGRLPPRPARRRPGMRGGHGRRVARPRDDPSGDRRSTGAPAVCAGPDRLVGPDPPRHV